MFVIQPGETSESIELYKTIIDFRQEEVPLRGAKITITENVRLFKKPVSVFAKWRSDTEQVKDKCLYEHDFVYWKLEKFVKDSEKRFNIEKLIEGAFDFLKSCFLEIASETAFPQVSQIGFANFC